MLTFDEAAHKYYWHSKPVPNVTSILSPLTDYSMIPAGQLEIARQKGVAAHKTVELWCKGDLDETNLPEWLKPVLSKWIDFVAHTGFRVVESEKKVYHPIYNYAGTLDLFGFMDHVGSFALVDLKRSFFAGSAIGLQLSAYLSAYAETVDMRVARNAKRYALRLNESGPIRLQEYTDPGQFGEFVALLTAQRVKEKYQ